MLFPTVYFGNLRYFIEFSKYYEVTIEAKEHFPKQSYRNRCEILTANGIQSLTVPVIKSNGSKTATENILISNKEDWRKDHWKAIESAYSSAPFFDHYDIEVKELIYQKEENLLKFNQNILKRITLWLDLPTEIQFSTDFTPFISNQDLRTVLSSKHQTDFCSNISYQQVFGIEFQDNLSILDAIFCIGPMSRKLLT